jgi:hypothetical protein
MGYSENERGEVVLTMSRDDYQNLLLALGQAVGLALRDGESARATRGFLLVNRLNEGNPRFTPYNVLEEEVKKQ